jgi:hypothetical protein
MREPLTWAHPRYPEGCPRVRVRVAVRVGSERQGSRLGLGLGPDSDGLVGAAHDLGSVIKHRRGVGALVLKINHRAIIGADREVKIAILATWRDVVNRYTHIMPAYLVQVHPRSL